VRVGLADTTLTAQLHTIEVDHHVSTGSSSSSFRLLVRVGGRVDVAVGLWLVD
jgi:hypothetical protein